VYEHVLVHVHVEVYVDEYEYVNPRRLVANCDVLVHVHVLVLVLVHVDVHVSRFVTSFRITSRT
jgi:hypothetical protein